MSIDTQKKLRFIPIVNVITLYYWFKNLKYAENKPKIIFKTLALIYFSMLLITIARIALIKLVTDEVVLFIGTLVYVYLNFFAISFFAVLSQEKMGCS